MLSGKNADMKPRNKARDLVGSRGNSLQLFCLETKYHLRVRSRYIKQKTKNNSALDKNLFIV